MTVKISTKAAVCIGVRALFSHGFKVLTGMTGMWFLSIGSNRKHPLDNLRALSSKHSLQQI